MSRLLYRQDVQLLMDMSECISTMEQAFTEFARGDVEVPLRLKMTVPEYNGVAYSMGAYLRRSGALGLKVITAYTDNSKKGLPNILGTILLMEPTTGEVLVIMDGSYITHIRTGATSALAAKYLAREKISKVGILGLGQQAFYQLWALSEVRQINHIAGYSPSGKTKRSAWVKHISEKIHIPIDICETPQEALEDCDVIILATNHRGPVINSQWVKPGTFINVIGYHSQEHGELDESTVVMADKIVCDSVDAVTSESGDIIAAIEKGSINREDLHNLGEVIQGNCPKRENDNEIIIYKSVGLAFQDIATALSVYVKACQKNRGMHFDFDRSIYGIF